MQTETENETILKKITKKPTKIKISRTNLLNDIEPLEDNNLDSLIAQQYIQFKIRKDPKDYSGIYNLPNGTLNSLWKFEHVKQFSFEFKGFYSELKNICTNKICPKMHVNESVFLCQAHGNVLRDCCAIDYFKHTLDWMDVILHENNFQSFIEFHSAFELLESIADRFLKIFWHSYFHHNKLFQKFENKTMLCSRFIYFGTKYNLIYEDFPKFDNSEENIFSTPRESLSDDKSEDDISLEKGVHSLGELTAVFSDLSYKKRVKPDDEDGSDFNKIENFESARSAKSYKSVTEDASNIEETDSLVSIEQGLLTHRTESSDEDCLSDKLKASPSLKSVYLKKGKYHPELVALSDSEKIFERTSEANYPDWLSNFVDD